MSYRLSTSPVSPLPSCSTTIPSSRSCSLLLQSLSLLCSSGEATYRDWGGENGSSKNTPLSPFSSLVAGSKSVTSRLVSALPALRTKKNNQKHKSAPNISKGMREKREGRGGSDMTAQNTPPKNPVTPTRQRRGKKGRETRPARIFSARRRSESTIPLLPMRHFCPLGPGRGELKDNIRGVSNIGDSWCARWVDRKRYSGALRGGSACLF